MHSFKIVFSTLFLLVLSLAVNAQTRLTLTWEVLKYDIDATLPQNFSDRDMDAKAILSLKNISTGNATKLTLRISDQAVVSAVTVNGAKEEFTTSLEKIGGNQNLQRVQMRVPSVAKGGSVTVSVSYKLKVKANSGLNSLSPVGSQFLPLSYWYPTPTSWYFNGGADYAPFTLKVNSLNGLTVISSGQKNASGFDQKLNGQPFFTAGNWNAVTTNGVEVLVPKGMDATGNVAKDLGNLAAEAKSYTLGLLGKSFDNPIRIVGVSRGSGFSDGGTIFIDESVFARQKLDSQTALSVIEGVVKIWLGNLVKVQDDSYGVIQEGLTRYIATEFIAKKYGQDVADLERLRQRTKYAAISERDAPLNLLSPVDGYYYTATANKGAMIWKYLADNHGENFYKVIQTQSSDGELNLKELRNAFSGQKEYLDYLIGNVTKMNLIIGLPQVTGNQTKVALRNLSDINVVIDVVATTVSSKQLVNKIAIDSGKFGEAVFSSPEKIVRVEIDANKIYPQTDYSDDVAPREIDDNDALVFIKREFDRQKYEAAEKNANAVLKIYPNFDDAKILLARSQLANGKTSAAQKNFQDVLDLKLPTAQSLAWANVGLGQVAVKAGQNAKAKEYFDEAIINDSELSATLTARKERSKIGVGGSVDAGIKLFFESFDKAVSTNNKAGIDAMVLNGEVSRFASSVAGQAQAWNTLVQQVDKIDEENVWVEVNLKVRLLNREEENGIAVYRLTKVGSEWKMSNVEIFEVG